MHIDIYEYFGLFLIWERLQFQYRYISWNTFHTDYCKHLNALTVSYTFRIKGLKTPSLILISPSNALIDIYFLAHLDLITLFWYAWRRHFNTVVVWSSIWLHDISKLLKIVKTLINNSLRHTCHPWNKTKTSGINTYNPLIFWQRTFTTQKVCTFCYWNNTLKHGQVCLISSKMFWFGIRHYDLVRTSHEGDHRLQWHGPWGKSFYDRYTFCFSYFNTWL